MRTLGGQPDQQHPAEACQESETDPGWGTESLSRCLRSFGFQAIAILLGIALAFM